MSSIQGRIAQRISATRKRRIHLSTDFLDVASRGAVDVALKRLTEKGTIQRFGQGLYGRREFSDLLQTELLPSAEEIVAAIAERDNLIVQPSGATAANMLGLTLQVPGKTTYITNGNSRRLKIGNVQIELRHASAKSLVGAGEMTGLVIQALKYLGSKEINEDVVFKLTELVNDQDKRKLLKNIKFVPAWMRPTIKLITQSDKASRE